MVLDEAVVDLVVLIRELCLGGGGGGPDIVRCTVVACYEEGWRWELIAIATSGFFFFYLR